MQFKTSDDSKEEAVQRPEAAGETVYMLGTLVKLNNWTRINKLVWYQHSVVLYNCEKEHYEQSVWHLVC